MAEEIHAAVFWIMLLCSEACGTNVSEKFCRQYVPPKSWYQSTKLHTATFQEITIFVLTAVATPNLMFCSVLCDGNIICQETTGRSFILAAIKHKIQGISIHILLWHREV
jgi:hypothetical protein